MLLVIKVWQILRVSEVLKVWKVLKIRIIWLNLDKIAGSGWLSWVTQSYLLGGVCLSGFTGREKTCWVGLKSGVYKVALAKWCL